MNIDVIGILTEIINRFGYAGIFIATGLEYACFPVSSEFLLPFIGYSVSKGSMSYILAVLSSTIGGVSGSAACYALGRFGMSFLENILFKRFEGLRKGIEKAGACFKKYGKQSVLIARVFPIARTYISIPAGMAKMNLGEFLLLSAIGAFVWNSMLIYIGFKLGENFEFAGANGLGNKIFAGILLILICVFSILSIAGKNRGGKRSK